MATQGVSYNPQARNWPVSLAEEQPEARAILAYSELEDWFVINSRPCKEPNIQERLRVRKIPSYFPIITQRRAIGGYCALFPGYVFFQSPARLISDIARLIGFESGTAGIGHILSFAGHPASLSHQVIKEIMNRHNVSGRIDLELERERLEREELEKLQPGDAVTTNSGPFHGVKAIFRERRGQDRVVLLYQMLGGQRSVELPARQVVKA